MRQTQWVLMVTLSVAAFAQAPEPALKSQAPVRYPPLARQARIQGQVHLEFFVNHEGDVVAVNVLSGHPMLAPAATDNVSSWKFEVPKGTSLEDQRYETVFDFEISTKDLQLPVGMSALAVLDSYRHVRVMTTEQALGGAVKSGCPSDREKQPPHPEKNDYVEMSGSGCLGTCPVYKVKIHATGLVEWDGDMFVAEKKKDSRRIEPHVARDLVSKFAGADFWALCSSYSASVTDMPTTTFEVQIGGREKKVSNYASSAPSFLDALEYAVWETADVHYWLHGDPGDEALSHISEDGYGPKPGLTPLMRAAARADLKAVGSLLKEGNDPNAVDASGWSVLMYAQPVEWGEGGSSLHTDLISVLLAAGADATYASPRGDTPLMAAAFDGRFEEILVRAGAKVNAQNEDGVSTLMILGSRAASDEIQKAMRTGADPRLKDAQGRTALDYLELSNCGQSPLRTRSDQMVTAESNDCNVLDEENFEKSKKFLTLTQYGSKSQAR